MLNAPITSPSLVVRLRDLQDRRCLGGVRRPVRPARLPLRLPARTARCRCGGPDSGGVSPRVGGHRQVCLRSAAWLLSRLVVHHRPQSAVHHVPPGGGSAPGHGRLRHAAVLARAAGAGRIGAVGSLLRGAAFSLGRRARAKAISRPKLASILANRRRRQAGPDGRQESTCRSPRSTWPRAA